MTRDEGNEADGRFSAACYLAMGLNNLGRTPQCLNDLICLIVLKMKGFILSYKDLS
jgi:hypothetical protein